MKQSKKFDIRFDQIAAVYAFEIWQIHVYLRFCSSLSKFKTKFNVGPSFELRNASNKRVDFVSYGHDYGKRVINVSVNDYTYRLANYVYFLSQ